MKIYLATDNQLEAIAKHDPDCSPFLLREVVEEMLNRNLFDGMINQCARMVFGSIKRMNEVHSMTLDDLLQTGRTAVFEGIELFKAGNDKTFSSFVFTFIKQRFIECIKFLEREKRDQRNEVKETETEEGLNMFDLMPSYINIEKYVIKKITLENLLNQLTKRQRQIVDLFLQDYNFDEIAEILGSKGKGRSLNKTYNDAIKKMRKGA